MAERWYTVTVVEHTVHPDRWKSDSPKPTVSVAVTVQPKVAVWVLRAAADEITESAPTP